MANNVFANGREISCKSGSGKTIAAFPDVCFTPPECPATPPGVPIPYPNTGMASDTTSGSKTVKISGKEVMLKDKSYFKKSTGDEAGCAAKKGVLTSVNTGKVYYTAWSMDVKVEGENVVRHLDLTTHNHASFPGNSPTWPFLDSVAFEGKGSCGDIAKEVEDKCGKHVKRNKKGAVAKPGRKKSIEDMCDDPVCKKARKCVLSTKLPSNCCPGQTAHHIVPKSQFKEKGETGGALSLDSGGKYDDDKAPCICVDGDSHSKGTHGEIHAETNSKTRAFLGVPAGKEIPDQRWPVAFAERIGAEAVEKITRCPKACTQAQVRAGHEKMGIKRSDKVRPQHAGGEPKLGPPILL